MNNEEYLKLAAVTDGDQPYYDEVIERFNKPHMSNALMQNFQDFVNISENLDYLKKVSMYGKDDGQSKMAYDSKFTTTKITSHRQAQLLHYLLGIVTEAGEIAEIAINLMQTGKFDEVNLKEELGDMSGWYTANTLRLLNSSYEEIFKTNIDKLKARYGEKFTEAAALNRDLIKERNILEK